MSFAERRNVEEIHANRENTQTPHREEADRPAHRHNICNALFEFASNIIIILYSIQALREVKYIR